MCTVFTVIRFAAVNLKGNYLNICTKFDHDWITVWSEYEQIDDEAFELTSDVSGDEYDEGPTNNMCTSMDKIAGLKTVKNFLVDSKNKKLIWKCYKLHRKLYI